MWNFVVLTVMLALAGGYALVGERDYAVQRQGVTSATAEGMAIYRGAVMRYYAANPSLPAGSVSFETLKASGMLRAWSTLDPTSWSNYRDAAHVIYIYATKLPDSNLSTDLARLSQGSVLAGSYHGAGASATLYPPRTPDTSISLAELASFNLQEGTPVWMVPAL